MPESSRQRINPWSVWALIAIMLGGLLVYYNWLRTIEGQTVEGRPPFLRPIKAALETSDRTGESVRLFSSRDGKIYLVGYAYFGDEVEAVAVCKRLQAMRSAVGDDKRVELVLVSMAPDRDSPKVLEAFASKHGFEGDYWRFVGGDRHYMNKFFRYPGHEKPDNYRETETDLYARELRISLVDAFTGERDQAFVRGVYWEGKPEGELRNDSRIEKDIRYLLDAEGEVEENAENQ